MRRSRVEETKPSCVSVAGTWSSLDQIWQETEGHGDSHERCPRQDTLNGGAVINEPSGFGRDIFSPAASPRVGPRAIEHELRDLT
jgi:hypothetical protein